MRSLYAKKDKNFSYYRAKSSIIMFTLGFSRLSFWEAEALEHCARY